MYALKDGAPRKLYYFNSVEKTQIDQLQQQFKNQKISISQLFWEYQSLAFDEIVYPEDKTAAEIWKKLTRVQKTILSISIFIGQVDNGGVWQFFYNKPTYAIAVADALDQVKPHNLIVTHYEKPLGEFINMINSGTYSELIELASAPALSHEERWNLFQSGKTHIPSHQAFDDFFYQEDNKIYLYQLLVKYVEQNMAKLFHIELPEGEKAPKVIQKKEAIPHFTAYLKAVYQEEPVFVKVYYTGRVTIDNQGTQLFLMHYKMPSGFESLGVTGFFTHHFDAVDIHEIHKMDKKYHKQKMINLYHGHYLVEKTLRENPAALKVDKTKWEAALQQMQAPKNTQIPVNVVFKEGILFEGEQWYLFEGDLYYNISNNTAFPEDLNQVSIAQYGGEKDLIFATSEINLPSFGGRMSRNRPVKAHYRLYDVIGNKYKLLKDNPWGF